MTTARFVVVVGSGGVGKTTVAAAVGVAAARAGLNTLVMTFDPSLRLKDALGVGDEARDAVVRVPLASPGVLSASLLDAGKTFDRLVARYAPDSASRDRIVTNRFYRHLSGALAGVLEYMAVERLYEVAAEGTWDVVVLDTPPTRHAIELLRAPDRIVGFLDSGALKVALRPWFDSEGRLRPTRRLGVLGRTVEAFFDNAVGLDLLRDMAEFFQAFAPLYEGFRARALEVRALLADRRTLFSIVASPAEEAIPDTMFLARALQERGYRLGPAIVNRVHQTAAEAQADVAGDGGRLLAWLGQRDAAGVAALRALLGSAVKLLVVPLLPEEPSGLAGLAAVGDVVSPVVDEAR